MATDNNIKTYTAADIEKYHKGLLSSKERHDLEKAALDDPFLADALEGYATAGVNVAADISELKNRLGERTDTAKVVSIKKTGGGGGFPFLRVAAILIVLVGGAYLTYQFAFNKKEDKLANVESAKKYEVKTADTSASTTTQGILSSDVNTTAPVTEETKGNKAKAAGIDPKTGTITTETKVESNLTTSKGYDDGRAADFKTKPVANAPGERKEVSNVTSGGYISGIRTDSSKDMALKKTQNQNDYAVSLDKDEEDKKIRQMIASGNNKNINAKRKAADQYYQATNTFRGRVTDASNVGIPFANVTNIQDNAGTYTDANGNFNFTSPDSILNVQVRSIGFENKVSELKNNVAFNQVVLQDDRKTLNEVVISNQRPNAVAKSRNANDNNTLEEPEPADGWSNYDAYLANNLVVPEEYNQKPIPNASVEVSFEVDKNGEPVNIKVERSLCGKCDKEAIRLIKEGPKWKRNAKKKGRTTVTINF